ncbi:hypothetical protein [Halomonas sp. CSM-2]|uniref:hypothetical protein n=1 Tax=Halomonas sp. CSM-2 TaxID=1975722 RepID=UPI000A28027E|nr:hypothetical protein [Halomonas sp. CSM-2]
MSPGRLILLTDLDDTLFASERSLPIDAERVQLAAVDGNGAPLSFQTHQQRTLWELLSGAADFIIPVTGRTSYALDRVALSFPRNYAVVSHGALVISEGHVLPAWQTRLAPHLDEAYLAIGRAYADLSEALQREVPHLQFTLRQLEDLSVPVYLSIKATGELPEVAHTLLSQVAQAHGLSLHANTRNAALRPSYTSKSEACRFLLEEELYRQPEDTIIAIGDSLSDLPFMTHSDMAMMPTGSQVWNAVKELAQ